MRGSEHMCKSAYLRAVHVRLGNLCSSADLQRSRPDLPWLRNMLRHRNMSWNTDLLSDGHLSGPCNLQRYNNLSGFLYLPGCTNLPRDRKLLRYDHVYRHANLSAVPNLQGHSDLFGKPDMYRNAVLQFSGMCWRAYILWHDNLSVRQQMRRSDLCRCANLSGHDHVSRSDNV